MIIRQFNGFFESVIIKYDFRQNSSLLRNWISNICSLKRHESSWNSVTCMFYFMKLNMAWMFHFMTHSDMYVLFHDTYCNICFTPWYSLWHVYPTSWHSQWHVCSTSWHFLWQVYSTSRHFLWQVCSTSWHVCFTLWHSQWHACPTSWHSLWHLCFISEGLYGIRCKDFQVFFFRIALLAAQIEVWSLEIETWLRMWLCELFVC